MGVGSAALALPELFTCSRISARLTTGACARLYVSTESRPPQIGESRAACVGCVIGASHAGRDIEDALRTQRARELDPVCVGCGRTGRRMVGGARCVSCYNRALEAARGRDARGRAPRFAGRYHSVSLMIVMPAGLPMHRQFAAVGSRAEAILIAAKQASGALVAIGFRRLSPLPEGAAVELGWAFAPQRGRRRGARAPALIQPRAPLHAVPQLELSLG